MSGQKEKNKELYYELKELEEQIQKIHAKIENTDEQIVEINTNKIILEKFKELKKGDEMRVPLTSGVYIKAELKDVSKVLINVGANVTLEKTPDEVIEILDSQLLEIANYREKLVKNMKAIITRIEEIQKELDL